MREISIDLSYRQSNPTVFAGYEGEHNATQVTVVLPIEMANSKEITTFYPRFCTSCREDYVGETIANTGNQKIIFKVHQAITRRGKTEIQIEGKDSEGNIIARSALGCLVFNPSVNNQGKELGLVVNDAEELTRVKEELQELIDEASELLDNTDLSNYYTKTETDQALTKKANKSELPQKVSELENDSGFITVDYVAGIEADVAGLQTQLNEEAHFRGYLSTNAKIQALDATPNDFAYSAESGTKWVYNANNGWQDTGVPVPDQLTPASNMTPLINGMASAGQANEYARGDHRHPTDTTRASVADLNKKADKPKKVVFNDVNTLELADNTIYEAEGELLNPEFNYPEGDFMCSITFTLANMEDFDVTVTLPGTSKYIGGTPTFAKGETWELNIKNGVVVGGLVE